MKDLYVSCLSRLLFSGLQPSTLSKCNLTSEEILAELLGDDLSDVPDDAISESEDDSDVIRSSWIDLKLFARYQITAKINLVPMKVTLMRLQIGGATTWVKRDKTPNLGPFIRNPGMKQILSYWNA